jgi:hypothetical protein
MSAIAKNTKTGNRYSNTRPKVGGGKFCKICKDMGKSMEEYTSHYVRETPDPTSKVVCPVLIAAVCRYCKAGGHTVKHCPKIAAKNRQEAKNLNQHIISKSYCVPVTDSKKNTKPTDKMSSVYAVLDFSSDEEEEEEEVVVTPQATDNVVSYASILNKAPQKSTTPSQIEEEVVVTPQATDNVVSYPSVLNKAPQKSTTPSQIESLIPSKLNFNDEDVVVVTLDMITKQWADDEDLDDVLTFDFLTKRPVFSDNTHPLHYYNNKMISDIVYKYTNGYTKKIRITENAFGELFQQWDTEFFTENDARGAIKITMNVDPRTNFQSRLMSTLLLFTR